ncbi:MAG: hypothetical protein FWH26_03700 [Oscillospiraceae bacterium]|nr:hypothetical protein [Oscillospiraceae bacterium]
MKATYSAFLQVALELLSAGMLSDPSLAITAFSAVLHRFCLLVEHIKK